MPKSFCLLTKYTSCFNISVIVLEEPECTVPLQKDYFVDPIVTNGTPPPIELSVGIQERSFRFAELGELTWEIGILPAVCRLISEDPTLSSQKRLEFTPEGNPLIIFSTPNGRYDYKFMYIECNEQDKSVVIGALRATCEGTPVS